MEHQSLSESLADSSTDLETKRTYEEIESWLVEHMSALSGLDTQRIDIDQPFVAFNLDSSLVVSMTHELSGWLGEGLPITLFWEFPTIRALAQGLSSS